MDSPQGSPQPLKASKESQDKAVKEMVNSFKTYKQQRPTAGRPNGGVITMHDLKSTYRALKDRSDVLDTESAMQDTLLGFYTSPEGRAEIEQAPQWLRDKPISEIVELLMGDVRLWAKEK